MTDRIRAAADAVKRFLGSALCWRIVFGLFVLETLWLVLSAQYPLAFDENYHFGLIQLHAQQWLPFFTSQPADAGVYGAIVRDPSYLYHWLMSFPYRLIGVFTDNQTAQIIFLRLINVGLFAYGLVLYRRMARRLGASPALSNSLLALFILIPIVPYLAAHINYDNLLLVMVPLAVLLALRLLDGFREKRVDAAALLWLFVLLLLGSLVKYPFLPVAAAVAAVLAVYVWRSGLLGTRGVHNFVTSFGRLDRFKQIVLIAACLLSFGLFAERYGVNLMRHHDPVPACNVAISHQECLQYGPYARDYGYTQGKSPDFHPDVSFYVWQWLRGMWYRLFFAINYNYFNNPPLYVISRLAIVVCVLLVAGIAVRFRTLFAGSPARQLVLVVMLGYVLVLFADGFSSYAKTGVAVAINGRYLIPFLPLLGMLGGLAWSQILRRYPVAKTAVAGLVLAVFLLQGGGTMTFIVRSSDDWYWKNDFVRGVNRTVRDVVSPTILGKGLQ